MTSFDHIGSVFLRQVLRRMKQLGFNQSALAERMNVSRLTASSYLDKIVKLGLLSKVKVGRTNYYINDKLVDLFVNHEKLVDSE